MIILQQRIFIIATSKHTPASLLVPPCTIAFDGDYDNIWQMWEDKYIEATEHKLFPP